MTVELIRVNEISELSHAMWRECLDVAKAFGWIPAGTIDPRPELNQPPSNGGYVGNDWQRVTDIDAYALTMSLLRAIAAIEGSGALIDRGKLAALKRVADFSSRGGFEIG